MGQGANSKGAKVGEEGKKDQRGVFFFSLSANDFRVSFPLGILEQRWKMKDPYHTFKKNHQSKKVP
jgi:hypothetical protein